MMSVQVDRARLKSVLSRWSKLTGKSLDVDGLVTVAVEQDGVHLTSLSTTTIQCTLPRVGEDTTMGGLGRVVVLAEHLYRVVAQATTDTLVFTVESTGLIVVESTNLYVGTKRVWTCDELPSTPAELSGTWDDDLSDAIKRALPFACDDAARPNINSVVFQRRGDHVLVEALNGHVCYRELVTVAPSLRERFNDEAIYKIPRQVLDSLLPGGMRRAKAVCWLRVSDYTVEVRSDDLSVRCSPDDRAYPPTDWLYRPVTTKPVDQHAPDGWLTLPAAPELLGMLGGATNLVEVYVQFVNRCGVASAHLPERADVSQPTGKRKRTPCSVVRQVDPEYLRLVTDVMIGDEPLFVTINNDPVDPIFLHTATRWTCLAPMTIR